MATICFAHSVLLGRSSHCNVPGHQTRSSHLLLLEIFYLLFYSIKNTNVLSVGPALVYITATETPGILIYSILFRNILIFSRKAQESSLEIIQDVH